MELLPILIVSIFVLFVVVVAAFVLYRLVQNNAASHATALNDQAIDAAVQSALKATLTEREATAEALERDREATLYSAVDKAVARTSEVVDAKLDARIREGDEKLAKNLAVGHEKYAAGTTVVEKQTNELRLEMKRIEKMMHDLQREAAGQHGMLVNQLQEAVKATGQLQQTTGSLREALGSSSKRGNWGERMAQDVLRFAGLVEGINYRVQKGIESGGRPDFTFLMPRDMVLHMDVKFPADNYLAFLENETTDAAAAENFRKQFVKDARARVKELSTRRYHEESDSVDAVVLLIPNESIFAFVQENDAELMDVAMKSKIVLCGPSTLIAVLQVIRQAMDNFMLERRSTEILECLNGFKAEWSKFSKEMERHGKHMQTAMNSYEALSGTRTNVLNRNLDKIERLQAATGTEPAVVAAKVRDEPQVEVATWPQLVEIASA